MPQTDEKSPIAVSLIVAAARNGVIGKGSSMPWHIPSDLRRFKQITLGKPIIMGRKTWAGLKLRPLPGRLNIILTRQADIAACGAVMAANLAQATDLAKAEAAKTGAGEIFIIGGADVFAQALPLADKIYLTEIQTDADGDAFFRPDLPPAQWQRRILSPVQQSEKDSAPYRFLLYIRKL